MRADIHILIMSEQCTTIVKSLYNFYDRKRDSASKYRTHEFSLRATKPCSLLYSLRKLERISRKWDVKNAAFAVKER